MSSQTDPNSQPTFKDLAPRLNLQKPLTVDFDPSAPVREFNGRNGAYPAVLVKVNKKPAWLPVSSSRLMLKLQQFEKPTTITITRTGEGFAIDYEVKVARA